MKYQVIHNTLIIKGEFEAISSGVNGGRKKVKALFNHTVHPHFSHAPPETYMKQIADRLHIPTPYFGLLTAVDMKYLRVITDDYLTAFITAGITNPSPFRITNQHIHYPPQRLGTINIILTAQATLSEEAMVGAIITATEAKALSLIRAGCNFLGTTTDAVIVACEKHPEKYIKYAGSCTEFGEKITKVVIKGIRKPLKD